MAALSISRVEVPGVKHAASSLRRFAGRCARASRGNALGIQDDASSLRRSGVATGETRSAPEFLDICFAYVGLKWTNTVIVEPRLYRPTEVDCLPGDATKDCQNLKWKPKISFAAAERQPKALGLPAAYCADLLPQMPAGLDHDPIASTSDLGVTRALPQ